MDGTGDSRSTSVVFESVTLYYAVCSIFPSKSSYFWPNKSRFFAKRNGIWPPFSHVNMEFMLKSGVFGE
jgi:hypothetical protein